MGLRYRLLLAVSALAAGTAALAAFAAPVNGVVEWTMIDVNSGPRQGDAHLLRFPDGTAFLVDAADTGIVAPWLAGHGVRSLDKVIISHPHKDHYGGLPEVLARGIAVGELVMNVPERAPCDREKPWGCDYDDVQRLLGDVRARHIPVRAAAAGDRLYARGRVSLEVLAAYDAVHTPFGPTDINDTSLILLLTNGSIRALFTGDLNKTLGAYLARSEPRVRADILKVPHHGTEDLAPDSFFDRVAPRLALVPSPLRLWESDRSRRAREYLARAGIPTLVDGRDGDVVVRIGPRSFAVVKPPSAVVSLRRR